MVISNKAVRPIPKSELNKAKKLAPYKLRKPLTKSWWEKKQKALLEKERLKELWAGIKITIPRETNGEIVDLGWETKLRPPRWFALGKDVKGYDY